MQFKYSLIFILIVLAAGLSVSQPTLPHRVYGEVNSSSDGSALEDVNVSFRNSSSFLVATQNTSSSGFYDLNLDGLDAGEDIYLFLDGSNTSEYVNFSRGSSTSLDCRFNSSSGACVEETPDDGSDNDQNQDDNQDTEEDQTDETDNGGSSGSSGGSGGGGGGGGGFGGFPSEDEDSGDSEIQSVGAETSLDRNLSSSVRFEEVSAGTGVRVNVSGESVLRGVNFDSAGNATAPALRFNSSTASPGVEGYESLEVFEIGLENVSSVNSSVGLRVDKAVLQQMDVSSGDLELRRYSGGVWNRIELSITSDLQSYLYEAELDELEGRYALLYPVPDEATGGLSVQDLSTESDGENVTVAVTVENTGSNTSSRSVDLELGGEVVETWQTELGPGETEELTYTTSLAPGTYIYTAGSLESQVEVSDSQERGLPFLLIIGGVILLVLAIIAYIFVTEYRSAAELEETISEIEEKGEDVNRGMQGMRDDLQRLRERVRSSDNK